MVDTECRPCGKAGARKYIGCATQAVVEEYEPMQAKNAAHLPDLVTLDDVALVQLARQRNAGAFCSIMHHNNQRFYRLAGSVVQDDSETEDTVE